METSTIRQNILTTSEIQNSIEIGLSKSQQIIKPPHRTKRFQNFQNLGENISLSFDESALKNLLEVGKNVDEVEEMEKRRKTTNAVGMGRNIADTIATHRSGIEFFAPEYKKDAAKQQIKNQQEHCNNNFQINGINTEEKRKVEREKIKRCEENFKKLNEYDEDIEEDEEFWTGISALKTTKYGISTWCIAWNGAALYYVSDRIGEFLLNILIGLLGFWQAKKISKKQNFRKLLKLLAPTLIFIQIALMVLQRNALEAYNSFKLTMPIAINNQIKKQSFDFQFDGQLASIFAIGNTILMLFVCYCNLSVLCFILQKIGTRLDELYFSNMEIIPKKVVERNEGIRMLK